MPKTNPKIRVRFAPSPTGFLHVGSLRTALYNYLFARQNKGSFILRIEDTDRSRYVKGAIERLIQTLQALGLEWEEGPVFCHPEGPRQGGGPKDLKILRGVYPFDKLRAGSERSRGARNDIIKEKGEFGPYIQSHRLDIYRKYAEELVEKGRAYYCFCSEEKLEKLRKTQELNKQPTMYDGYCRPASLRTPEGGEAIPSLGLRATGLLRSARNDVENKPYVVRLAVPKEGITKFNDLIRGEIKFENKLIDDQILLKSDGYPTYHLANVVDDHLMKISHVIRGEEWLSSTPKHILLYQAFGWEPPQFAHLSLLLNPDRSKLSKRQGDVAAEDYLKKGYLPEALLNFVALLGWSSVREPDREIFTLSELIKEFSLERISLSGAIFNLEKLDWLNGRYIRQMPIGELVELCLPYLAGAGLMRIPNSELRMTKLKKIIKLEQERLKKLSDLPALVEFFFKEPDYPAKMLIWRKSDASTTRDRLFRLSAFYNTWSKKWTKENLEKGTLELIQKENLDNGATLWPMRTALSGREASPGPFEIADILGQEETVRRLKKASVILSATK